MSIRLVAERMVSFPIDVGWRRDCHRSHSKCATAASDEPALLRRPAMAPPPLGHLNISGVIKLSLRVWASVETAKFVKSFWRVEVLFKDFFEAEK